MQPATRVYPTPCHAGRGLAGHPRSVRVGYGIIKTRLFTPIRSKTPAFQRRGLHLGARRERSRSTLRGDDVAGKRSHRNGSSSFERVRLLQPLLPRPQKGWRPLAHPRSQTPESRPHETAVQDDHAEADPLAEFAQGTGSVLWTWKMHYFHIQIAPITDDSWDSPSREWLTSTRSYPLGLSLAPRTLRSAWTRLFPLSDRWESASQLPRRLAHSGPVRGGLLAHRNPHPQPLRAPGAQGQFRQKAHCLPANEYRSWV